MKGDFSRNTFDRRRHVSRVLMQQGRVLVDADWNEQTSVLLHYLRTVIADFSGPIAAIGDAFLIAGLRDSAGNPIDDDFAIVGDHLYLDGILVENDGGTTFLGQPVPPLDDPFPLAGTVLAYIDVWERHVTHVQLPHIREVALGGPDTCSRAVVAWQIRIADREETGIGGLADWSDERWDTLVARWQPRHRGWLKAWAAEPGVEPDDACVTPPEHRYRGTGNRLYRVEVHRGGTADEATFVWSRENGSVVAQLTDLSGTTATVDSLGADEPHSFAPGDWVEFMDDRTELAGTPGVLAEVVAVDSIDLTLELDPAGTVLPDFDAVADYHPILRRWDHRHGVDGAGHSADDGALVIDEGTPIALEDGIVVQFAAVDNANEPPHRYRTGDYWLIPARTETGDVEWPTDGVDPAALPPMGVEHHYAPIALLATGAAPIDLLADYRTTPGS